MRGCPDRCRYKSSIAATALDSFVQLYQVERDIQALTDPVVQMEQRRDRACPIAQTLHAWLMANAPRFLSVTATANALDYSLNRGAALTRICTMPGCP